MNFYHSNQRNLPSLEWIGSLPRGMDLEWTFLVNPYIIIAQGTRGESTRGGGGGGCIADGCNKRWLQNDEGE